MFVFVNGFWEGFLEKKNAVHFGVFQTLLSNAFKEAIYPTTNYEEADILLESSFGDSALLYKKWTYSIFFSGEGGIYSYPLPFNWNEYTIVLGSQKTNTNFVSCPLYILYDLCNPFNYPKNIVEVPKKDICAIISNDNPQLYRNEFIQKLEEAGFHVDMAGKYKNNIGYIIPGDYSSDDVITFQKEYKLVLALENTKVDDYITEKVINPIRAGVIPVYFGSSHIEEYIYKKRLVEVNQDNLDITFSDIKRLLTDDVYWLEKANTPNFVKSSENLLNEVATQMKILIEKKPFYTELIANYEVEKERHEDIHLLMNIFNIKPSYECYGNSVKQHPLFDYFSNNLNTNEISLAINHITLFKKYANKNIYLLLLESDAIPLFDYQFINFSIINDIESMKKYNLDFIFLGKGCFDSFDSFETIEQHLNHVENPINKNLPYRELDGHIFCVNKSRCTESYIVAPSGIIKFLNWFYSNKEHPAIDWAFNNFFKEDKTSLACWRHPELFKQGSSINKYMSLVQKKKNTYTLRQWQNQYKGLSDLIVQASAKDGSDSWQPFPIGMQYAFARIAHQLGDALQIGLHEFLVMCAISDTTDENRRKGEHTRKNYITTLQRNGIFNNNMHPDKYFQILPHVKFVISPEGNGIDCHRHYEALMAGCIPIIEHNPLIEEKYKGCPVLYTTNYSEITEEYLTKKYEEMIDQEYDFSCLFLSYYTEEQQKDIKECGNYWLNQNMIQNWYN